MDQNKENYLLVMLGTNTEYNSAFDNKKNEQIKLSNYKIKDIILENIRTDSLCFITDIIKQNKIDSTDRILPHIHAAQYENADIINGPDPLGYQVYNRIAHGLLLTIAAIIAGKKNLMFLGHSRGGVEIILMTHALQKIKDIISTENRTDIKVAITKVFQDIIKKNESFKLAELFLNKKESNTIINQLQTILTDNNINLLLNNINDSKVNVVTVDPVPGAGWVDEEFSKPLPAIISTYYQFVPNNEYSIGFDALVPQGVKPENIINTPGHHGSFSGNVFDQTKSMYKLEKLPEDFFPESMHMIPDYFILFTLDLMKKNNFVFKNASETQPIQYPALQKVFNKHTNPEYNFELLSKKLLEDKNLLSSINYLNKQGGAYLLLTTGCDKRRQITDELIETGLKNYLNIEHIKAHTERFLAELNKCSNYEKLTIITSFLIENSKATAPIIILDESISDASSDNILARSRVDLAHDSNSEFCQKLIDILSNTLDADNNSGLPELSSIQIKHLIKNSENFYTNNNDRNFNNIKKVIDILRDKLQEKYEITTQKLAEKNNELRKELEARTQEFEQENLNSRKQFEATINILEQEKLNLRKEFEQETQQLKNNSFSAIRSKILYTVADILIHLLSLTLVLWWKIANKKSLSFFTKGNSLLQKLQTDPSDEIICSPQRQCSAIS